MPVAGGPGSLGRRRRPWSWPWATAAGLVLGGRMGEWLGAGPGGPELVVALACSGVAVVARGRTRMAAVVLACVALGAVTTERALHGLVDTPLWGLADRGASGRMVGTLAEDPGGGPYRASALVRVDAIRSDAAVHPDVGRTALVVGTGDAAARLGLLAAGDRVTVRGWFRPLEGTESRLRWRHTVATFEATDVVGFEPASSPLARVANRLRDEIERGVRPLTDPERGLVLGFLVGDTRAVPLAVVDDFRAAGMSHLLAVSGSNVAFVLALFGPLLTRSSRLVRLVLVVSVIVVFGAMTRWEPSVLRACTMAAIAAVGVYVGRPGAGLHHLGLAVSLLLALDPFLTHSVGFLLSTGASLGILVLGPPLARRLRGPAVLRDALAVTVAAQLGVVPVLVPVFGSVSLVSIPANLVVVPMAEPLTAVGLAGAVVSARLAAAAPLARAALFPAWALARAVRAVAEVAATVPVAVGPHGVLGVSVLAAGALGLGAVIASCVTLGPVAGRRSRVRARRRVRAPDYRPERSGGRRRAGESG